MDGPAPQKKAEGGPVRAVLRCGSPGLLSGLRRGTDKASLSSGHVPVAAQRGLRLAGRSRRRGTPVSRGIDLACAEGTTVLAALDGVVTAAQYSASYGNYLRLIHADGFETVYAHLQYLYVRPGEVVRAGQAVGSAGETGRATGPHLHFEVLRKSKHCDPASALGLAETGP